MSEECTHNCSTCSANCSSRDGEPQDLRQPLNQNSRVGKVYAVVSGKGGVGKSLVTSVLACETRARGFNTAILDADVTGPSIPKAFGIHGQPGISPDGFMMPATTSTGIQVISTNMLLENETDPVIWRGPIIAGIVTQFWTDTVWENVDYMYVDMPPGTGDVPLTVFQSLAIDGIIIVTSPQELVGMIVEKAVNMAKKMDIPIVGLVENYSYYECPECHTKHAIFGESKVDAIAAQHGIPVLAKLPIDPLLARSVDEGLVEYGKLPDLSEAIDILTK